jgi:glycosyltransferase involved in cell wall biosynthesis
VRFLVIGDGPLRGRLDQEFKALGLMEAVTLVGFKPWLETPFYLNAMDIFCFPSHREAFGLALAEAMACGVAAVARSSVGSREIITDGENGYLIHSDDELFARLLRLGQDKRLRQEFGHKGCDTMQKRRSWEAVAARSVQVYRDVLQTRAGKLSDLKLQHGHAVRTGYERQSALPRQWKGR